ncbi:hypothetical protein TSUD_151100 [Trifolium subterraneum]|uniref:phosphoribosylaminoimidazole carboxylase n=1 Tax=Trifolium subterraneum TaxID=3900 RepID=A0A2Z6MNX0_TRISU|nr:hypothetical protein TSUD_151100 [Trifolium subterraneum]
MPRGVPVATVAVNNATNAGLLAVRMLGIADDNLLSRMSQYQEDQKESVLKKGDSHYKEVLCKVPTQTRAPPFPAAVMEVVLSRYECRRRCC